MGDDKDLIASGAGDEPADELLLEHRRYLRDAHQTASRDFDRALLAMASGAIAISLAFLDDITSDPRRTWLMLFAWLLLAGSLGMNLVSHMTSQRAIIQDIDKLDRGGEDIQGGNRWTPLMNHLSAVGLVGGVVLLVLFAYYNLGHG